MILGPDSVFWNTCLFLEVNSNQCFVAWSDYIYAKVPSFLALTSSRKKAQAIGDLAAEEFLVRADHAEI